MDAEKFSISYKPEPWTKAEYVLGRCDNHVEAIETACGYSKMFYGEISPIIVREGRRKIHTIPAGAGRT